MKLLDILLIASFVFFVFVFIFAGNDNHHCCHHCLTEQDLFSGAIEEGWTQEELSKLNELLGKNEEDN